MPKRNPAPTPLGYQPIRIVLYERRLNQQEVAADLGVTWGHFRRVLTGRCHPMPILLEKLPEYLGLPLEKLFTPEMLAKPYVEGRGVKK